MMTPTKKKISSPGAAALLVAAAIAAINNAVSVDAVKDDEYYKAGMGNPNVDLKMYWADAHNVLEDLDQFSALYVQYHNCAWSQNRQYYTDEDDKSAEESDYWYIGATPDFTANVAYSLYGVLKGESSSGSSPCSANTFINSFTTSAGFEVFASALKAAGVVYTDYSQSYSSTCGGGKGVACDYNVGFAYVTYSTTTCDPRYATAITDTMAYMNADFQKAQCVRIYSGSSSSSYSNNNYNNNGGGRRDLQREQELQETGMYGLEIEPMEETKSVEGDGRQLAGNYGYGYGYGYNNYYNYYGTPLALLFYSNACFIQNFWAPNGGCPDPYGRLQFYQQNFNKGVRRSMKVDPYVKYRANMEKGKDMVKSGAILFMAAAVLYLLEQVMVFRKRFRGPQNQIAVRKTTDPTVPPATAPGVEHSRSSVVGLVRSATGKLAGAVAGAAAATAAIVTSRSKCMDQDGVCKDVDDGSYVAPSARTNNSIDAGSAATRSLGAVATASSMVSVKGSPSLGAAASRDKGNYLVSTGGGNVSGLSNGDEEHREPVSAGPSGNDADGGVNRLLSYEDSAVEILRSKASGVRGLFGKMKAKVVPEQK